MTPTTLNRRALDCAPLDILLPQRLVAITPIGDSYSKIDRPIWPIYGPGVGHLLSKGCTAGTPSLALLVVAESKPTALMILSSKKDCDIVNPEPSGNLPLLTPRYELRNLSSVNTKFSDLDSMDRIKLESPISSFDIKIQSLT